MFLMNYLAIQLNININLILFISSCFMFSFLYKHILLNLMSMEFMMINMFMMMYYLMKLMNMNLFFLSIFIGISICEGVLGLSILVYMIRLSGNDYSNLLNLLKW